MQSDDTPVAMIGLGNLGLAMAARLASSGWDVRGFDASSDRVGLAKDRGISPTDEQELSDCRLLCIAVPDASAIREVVIDTGLAARLTRDHTIIIHSTILPTVAQQIAAEVASAGPARVLEVPVSGGSERAERGELTLFAAGEPTVIDDARALLASLGDDIVEVGPIGAGSATKLANQLVMFAAHAALVEGLRLAESYGVAEASVLKALETATGDTWVGRNWGFFDRTASDYNRAGVPIPSRPWAKDTAEILEAGSESGIDLPLARLVAASIVDTIETHAGETHASETDAMAVSS